MVAYSKEFETTLTGAWDDALRTSPTAVSEYRRKRFFHCLIRSVLWTSVILGIYLLGWALYETQTQVGFHDSKEFYRFGSYLIVFFIPVIVHWAVFGSTHLGYLRVPHDASALRRFSLTRFYKCLLWITGFWLWVFALRGSLYANWEWSLITSVVAAPVMALATIFPSVVLFGLFGRWGRSKLPMQRALLQSKGGYEAIHLSRWQNIVLGGWLLLFVLGPLSVMLFGDFDSHLWLGLFLDLFPSNHIVTVWSHSLQEGKFVFDRALRYVFALFVFIPFWLGRIRHKLRYDDLLQPGSNPEAQKLVVDTPHAPEAPADEESVRLAMSQEYSKCGAWRRGFVGQTLYGGLGVAELRLIDSARKLEKGLTGAQRFWLTFGWGALVLYLMAIQFYALQFAIVATTMLALVFLPMVHCCKIAALGRHFRTGLLAGSRTPLTKAAVNSGYRMCLVLLPAYLFVGMFMVNAKGEVLWFPVVGPGSLAFIAAMILMPMGSAICLWLTSGYAHPYSLRGWAWILALGGFWVLAPVLVGYHTLRVDPNLFPIFLLFAVGIGARFWNWIGIGLLQRPG
ncbi:MAG: hypothetical protein CMO80_02810 [Verrucomicrobiales bacterium]|nr:hypothetical protein [Verrucomicrobiales bacterium]